jgi:hypothetical protein
MTACGGNFIGGEIIRNKQCPHDSAERSEAEDEQSLDCRPKPALPRSGAARGVKKMSVSVGNAILQEIDASTERLALPDFQSLFSVS